MSSQHIANDLLSKGLSIIPVVMPDKRPTVKWEEFQQRIPEAGELSYNGAIALICGKVSGNLECFDIDVKHDPTLINRIKETFGDFLDEIWESVLVQKTISGGYHFIYRCDEIGPNTKLAQLPNKEVILETRGEGGYIIIAPTEGYKVINGSFDEIPTITPELRRRLFSYARQLNDYWPKAKEQKPKTAATTIPGVTPWDDYNNKTDIGEFLKSHGWTYISSKAHIDYYKRPGDSKSLHSGSFHRELNLFYVYTSSTALEPGKAYTPYALLSHLEFNSDYSACAKALIDRGFGTRTQEVQTTTEPDGTTKTVILTRIKKIENWLTDNFEFRRNIINSQLYFRERPHLDENTTQIDTKAEKSWQVCNENDVWRAIQHNLNDIGKGKRGGEISVPLTELCSILDSSYVPEYNPFMDYFDTLPPWDGKDHITALAKHVITDDPNFWIVQFKKALVRMIACTLYRTVNRIVITLVGETQETGKSTFIRFLCPPLLRDYYKEEPLLHDKDSEIALAENFIWNLEELDDLNRKQISEMKAIISRENIKHRRAYARYEKSQPRIVNFWGSTNKTDFLTDTQNTRWICFNVLNINHDYNNTLSGTKNVNINLVWAQALHLYRTGFIFNLTAEERQRRDDRNRLFETMTSEKHFIMKHIQPGRPEIQGSEFMANTDILEYLNLQTSAKTRLNINNIGRSMTQLDFIKDMRKINGKSCRGYWVIKNSGSVPFDLEPPPDLFRQEQDLQDDKEPF